MRAFGFTVLLGALFSLPLFGQEPPRISMNHAADTILIKLPWSRQTNSWCVQASANLLQWINLGELIEINGPGEFPDAPMHLHKRRFYRAIHLGTDLQAALDRNRARWDKSGITNYDFTFRWICFCVPEYVTPVRISVRNDAITAIARDGADVPASQFGNYRTIDGLFDLLHEALDQHPYHLSARFDPTTGAPLKAWIDYDQWIADEERGFVVEDLSVAGATPVQITDTPPAELQLDPFSLQDATVRGNTLVIHLQHSGGCAAHDYELLMSPGAFLESFPVQASLYLRHNAHGDACRALIFKELTFDLSPIADLYTEFYGGQNDPILLNVHDYFTGEPGEPIQVRWDRSLVQITDKPPAELQLDPFWLTGASIEGDILTLSVDASGGCRPHTYELFMSPAAFLKSLPPQANLYLRHDGHDDPCDAIVHNDVSFNVKPIVDLNGGSGPIILNIYEHFTDTPSERIQVTYK